MLLHHAQESDDGLGHGSEEHLSLSGSLGVHDSLEGIGQSLHSHHFI